MKKLTILLLLFTVFAFTEWDTGDTGGGGTMSGDAIEDSLNNATRTATQVWYFGDTVWSYYGTDSFPATYVDGGKLHFGAAGLTEIDSAQLGGGATLKKWVQVGSYMAFIENDNDTLYAIPDTTQLGGSGAEPDTFVWMVTVPRWLGGNGDPQWTSTACYFVSASANNSMYSPPLTLPVEHDFDNATIDSLILPIKIFNAVNDSVMMVLQQITDPQTFSDIDSVLVVSAGGGWQNINLNPNGDLTPIDLYGYRIHADGHNANNTSLRIGCFLRVVWHK